MAFPVGFRLGAYEIIAPLGAGGMGEVYRARDTKLKRDVALKVLPTEVANDRDRLARFQREAEVLASLNHPHIAHIHGLEMGQVGRVGQVGQDTPYLVMELVEGEELSQRIARGPVPIDEALPIARQIAEALEAAHEQGIIHRDLKPANIKVRADGTVKVLDFGLAKALDQDPKTSRPQDLVNSPTITSPAMTQAGMILGTAAYMSPEQAKGKPVDKRADIWAFGAVLYEMLAGRRAFGGDDITDTLTAIMRDTPDVAGLPASTPAAVTQLIERCLDKDARLRLRDIGEARLLLDGRSLAAARSGPPRTLPASRAAWAVAAIATITTAIAVTLLLLPRAAAPARQIKFAVQPPSDVVFGASGPMQALSSDGRRLAFVSPDTVSRPEQLWVRSLDAIDSVALAGTEGASNPFWSPDGSSIAYFDDGKLKRIAATGGPVQTICDVEYTNGGSWSPDGVIVFEGATGLLRVPAAGGQPAPLTMLDAGQGELSHRWPFFLPDGQAFVYLRIGQKEKAVYVARLDGTVDKRLVIAESKPEFSSGHLLFIKGGLLLAQPVDGRRLEIVGDAFPVAEDVGLTSAIGAAAFAASSDGVISYRAATIGFSQLTWFDRSGRAVSTLGAPGPVVQLSLSPDQQRVAVQHDVGTKGFILVYDARGAATRAASAAAGPVWSPDSRELIYYSMIGGPNELFRTTLTAAQGTRILSDLVAPVAEHWSSDGRHLAYLTPTGAGTLFVVPLDGREKPVPIRGTDEPQFSPDNKWLAFQSNESGPIEIFLQQFPGPGERVRLSVNGGLQPKWRADGKEIFYLTPDGTLTAVAVTLGERVEAAKARPLFQTRLNVSTIYDQYAVSADGQRFLVASPIDRQQSPVTVVVNWPATLPARR